LIADKDWFAEFEASSIDVNSALQAHETVKISGEEMCERVEEA
jgi:hypothetical protein